MHEDTLLSEAMKLYSAEWVHDVNIGDYVFKVIDTMRTMDTRWKFDDNGQKLH